MRCQDGAVDRRNVRTDLQDQLNADLVKAGYYPVLVQGVLDVALAGEEVRAYLVHPETTFDAREVRRHLTALHSEAETQFGHLRRQFRVGFRADFC